MIIKETDFVIFYSEQHQVWENGEGEYHRLGGPAVIHPEGYQAWYLKGKCHRVDGPAVVHPDGSQEWYLNGKPVTQEAAER